MKILFINSLDKRYGGTYRARALIKIMKDLKYDVTYVESNYYETNGINIPQSDTLLGYLLGSLRRALLCFFYDYQLLFLHKFLPLNFLCIVVAKLRNKKILVEWDDLDSEFQSTFFRKKITNLLEKYIPRYVDCIITHNRYLKDYAKIRGAKRVYIVPQGVDTELFNPVRFNNAKRNSKILLWLGTLTEGGARDLDVILEGFKLIKDKLSDVELWIVGDGPLRNKFELMGIDGVKFIGIISHDVVPEYIARADIALIFMRNNLGNKMRMSMKLLEYLAMGKKVVGHLFGVSKEKLGRFCYLCEPSTKSLAEKVIEVMYKNLANAEMRSFIQKNYSMDIVSKKLKGVISTLCQK